MAVSRLQKRWEVRKQKRKYSQDVGWNIRVDGEVTRTRAGLRLECKSEPDSEILSEWIAGKFSSFHCQGEVESTRY